MITAITTAIMVLLLVALAAMVAGLLGLTRRRITALKVSFAASVAALVVCYFGLLYLLSTWTY